MNELTTNYGGDGDGRNLPAHGIERDVINEATMMNDQESESPLSSLLRIVRRRRWVIIGITGACLLAALVVSLLVEPQYTAETRIEIRREADKVLNMDSVEQEAELADREFYQTQYELLESRTLAEAVVRDLRLAENEEFLDASDMNGADAMELPRNQRVRLASEVVMGGTTIAPVRQSSIVDVKFTFNDPTVARDVADSLAENFIQTNLARRFEATSYARDFLEERLVTTRAKLEESERQAAAYAQRQGLIKITDNESGAITPANTLATADLAQLSQELAVARAQRERAEAALAEDRGGRAAASALINDTVTALRRERGERAGELAQMRSDFGPEYPALVALEQQVAALDREIEREVARVASSLGQESRDAYRKALAAEQRIQARVNALKGDVLDTQQRAIAFNIIQRDVDTNRQLYEALLQRFKEIGVAGGVGTNNVAIVDPALVPEEPSSPNIPLNLALGLILGFAISGAAVFALEQIADSVILPSDFQRKLGTPLLGTTPKLIESKDEEGIDRNNTALTESYFSTLTAIQFSTAHGTPRSMLVTSSQEGEGKSTTAFSLARDLAAVGAKVLIIDADMRRPSLHTTLGRPLGKGLSDILVNRMQLQEAVFETGFANLSAVLAGSIPPNPAELLSGPGMKQIVAEAVKHYDHIIVDGPPVLGLADAPLLSRAVEGTVFVVEYGRTVAAQARLAIQRLATVRASIVGAVLTKLDAESAGYGSNYGYRYNYGDK
ncbi:GumC family protein [Sphingomicrobium marinum]|uniref:GumC family protein n=1 Tax=Sphingomicrobium marinum TaxID=1227950 RepID=UPI00223EB11C|nr:polysaccharide biosynthesis tyrosine autokinase [Sphingomicrobium marinum]